VFFSVAVERECVTQADSSDDRHDLAEMIPDMPIKPGGMEAIEEYEWVEQTTLVRGFHAQDDGRPAATQILVMVAIARVVALDLDLEAERWEVVFDEVDDEIPDEYDDHRKPAVPYARDLLAEQAPDMEALFGDRAILPATESETA
jgi:hypothetical protein